MNIIPAATAVQATLARIRACAATAALAILIVPLAAPAAQALIAAPTSPYVVATSFTNNGVNFITYAVYNTNAFGYITQIELPEIHAGDINFNNFIINGVSALLGTGFTQTEYTTAQFSTSTIVRGTKPGAYVDLTGNFLALGIQNGIAPGTNQSFTAPVPTAATTDANFTLYLGNPFTIGDSIVIDPPIPDTGTAAVPEPASLALLGAGLLTVMGLRRRKA